MYPYRTVIFNRNFLCVNSMNFLKSNPGKTFKPIQQQAGHRKDLASTLKATLGSGNIKKAVVLPKGEILEEWIAVNICDLFNEISLLYGAVIQFCKDATCPTMAAGESVEYLWGEGHSKPVHLSAPKYVDTLLSWAEVQLQDESIFPTEPDVPFPKEYMKKVQTIFKRLFRIYAHIYYSHFQNLKELGAEAHLNTCFKHFIFFSNEFKLIPEKEMAPLSDLIGKLFERESLK